MDDILGNINTNKIDSKLAETNQLHPKLQFTIEREEKNMIRFIDMKIMRSEGKLTSTWYSKSKDTGLTVNFHALVPTKYKRSVVSGMVHKIFHACSTWENFHGSLERAKNMFENNQYPPSFINPIIKQTLEKIQMPKSTVVEDKEDYPADEKRILFNTGAKSRSNLNVP